MQAKVWAAFSGFDPNEATVVVEPVGEGEGYWAGAPSVAVDPGDGSIVLCYRIRRPRGVEPDRGAEIRLMRSTDGIRFEEIWRGEKGTLGTTSIERCTPVRFDDGRWGLFVSYVNPTDRRWRVDLVEADRPTQFHLKSVQPVLDAATCGCEGVKDPFVFRVGNLWHMIASFATADGGGTAEEMHGTHDAYNTGLIRSRSGLATSVDGRTWQWSGEIFGPSEEGWDRYCARIGSIWREDGIWLALYDGSADVSENYEERLGLAYSYDLRTFQRVTTEKPLREQPHGRGAFRYVDVIELPGRQLFYFETSRADGSHDLRVWERPR